MKASDKPHTHIPYLMAVDVAAAVSHSAAANNGHGVVRHRRRMTVFVDPC